MKTLYLTALVALLFAAYSRGSKQEAAAAPANVSTSAPVARS
ncbi:hypothetical protein [Hymenobacter oligotrophus]|nr:hypothetical protein [Hymenobacter oligotrophus]